MKHILLIITIAILMAGCNTKIKDSYLSVQDSETVINVVPQANGKKLMENNCYACHNPKTSQNDMIAPPMIAVKMHYISENTTEEEFIRAMLDWSKKPSEEISKMPGAIRKFGLMPYQYFPEETIREIAGYMYNNEIEEPEWFNAHYNEMHGKGKMKKKRMGMGQKLNGKTINASLSIEEKGMIIASTTKAELGKNLMGQIQKNGILPAIEFCNINALALTDSMATFHNATIKRVSDKTRNPKNSPSREEIKYIEIFKEQLANGREIAPIITETGDQVAFYYPIVTNSMCLKCHGTPNKEIEPLSLEKIQELYPNDQAIGYNINEVRGIWSIGFKQ